MKARCLGAIALIILFCAAAASANARGGSVQYTVTTKGKVFLLNDKPFFPILSQAVGCPDQLDTGSPPSTIADDMSALGVNVVLGEAKWCGSDPGNKRLDDLLSARSMKWAEQDKSATLTLELPELVDWQVPVFSDTDLIYGQLSCRPYSSLAFYNKIVQLEARGPVVATVVLSAPPQNSDPNVCSSAAHIRSAFMTSLVAGAGGLNWMVLYPFDSHIGNGYSVPTKNRDVAIQLTRFLSAHSPVLLSGLMSRIKLPASQPIRASAWKYGKMVTIIAVNTGSKRAKAKMKVKTGKLIRTVNVNLLGNRSVTLKFKVK